MFNTDINTIYNSKDILKTLDKISDNEKKSISLIPFGCVSNIFEIITKKVKSNKIVEKIKEKKNVALYKLDRYNRTTGELAASGNFLIYKLPNYQFIYLLVTIEESDFFHRDIRPFIKSFYNDVILSVWRKYVLALSGLSVFLPMLVYRKTHASPLVLSPPAQLPKAAYNKNKFVPAQTSVVGDNTSRRHLLV